MTNTESKLKWTRVRPGSYTTSTDPADLGPGYAVIADDLGPGWDAWTPADPDTGRRGYLGMTDTLREGKVLCERHAATPTPAEWVEQLIALLDADTNVRFTKDADLVVTAAPVPTNLDRVRQAAHAAIELGICEAVPQIDLSERVQLTTKFRQERAEARGIVPGAIVHYQSPPALRPNAGRWEVVEIVGQYVRVRSPQGVWSAWPLERAVLADRHGYVSDLSGRIDGPCLTAAYDCPYPAGHPIHL